MAAAAKGPSDAEGFITVQPLRTQRAEGAADAAGQPGACNDDQMDIDNQATREAGDHGGAERDEDDGTEPTADDLRGTWEAAKDLLAHIKKQGHPEGHPLRRNAQEQVDKAYAEWQSAKPPTAPSKRMVWAEQALERARRALARAEQDLDDFDRDYELEREKNMSTLNDARVKLRERTQYLADLSREAADEYDPSAGASNSAMLLDHFNSLDQHVGPVLEDLLATLPAESEQHAMLKVALEKVVSMHASLGVATGGATADFYDMSDGPAENEAPGRAADGGSAEQQAQRNMDTTDVRVPRWMEDHNKRAGPGGTDAGRGGVPRWKKVCVDVSGPSQTDRGGGDHGDNPGTTDGTLNPTDDQNDGCSKRRAEIIAQAQRDGVEMPPGHLEQLCPGALEEWAKENLL